MPAAHEYILDLMYFVNILLTMWERCKRCQRHKTQSPKKNANANSLEWNEWKDGTGNGNM